MNSKVFKFKKSIWYIKTRDGEPKIETSLEQIRFRVKYFLLISVYFCDLSLSSVIEQKVIVVVVKN